MSYKSFIHIFFCLLAICFSGIPSAIAGNNPFVVVIDAGHGGKDPGAIGKITREKHINLAVALKLGQHIKRNQPNVKVVFTRTEDHFVELQQRSNIANRAKADLFISIHTNAAQSSSAYGTETYSLGLARSNENLEVAKRENSVILLEDDFSTRYEGFDPKSTESYIMFEFLQDKHMEQSINLASSIQKEFRNSARRSDRGVRQAGFLVLRTTGMPSVLVELGYISNPAEERYLHSNEGQEKLAQCIYNAFCDYKAEFERKQKGSDSSTRTSRNDTAVSQPAETEPEITQAETKTVSEKDNQLIYKIQLFTSPTRIKAGSTQFKGLSPVEFYKEKGLYKYTYQASTSQREIERKLPAVRKKFKDAFIVKFRNGQKVSK